MIDPGLVTIVVQSEWFLGIIHSGSALGIIAYRGAMQFTATILRAASTKTI